MRIFSALILLPFFFSCKKSPSANPAGNQYTDTSHILQEVKFRVKVVNQSEYDSAHNITSDSINIVYNRNVGDPYYLENLNTYMTIFPGFSFSFRDANGTPNDHDFILGEGFLPDFSNVKLNTPYEINYNGIYNFSPILISCHQGAGPASWRYFLSQDQIPADGTIDDATAKVYCKVTITRKYDVHWKGAIFTILDGNFSGYYEGYFGKDLPGKYMQRLEFSCTFQGVKVAS